ncbi:MAG: hypothetical protein ACRDNW_13270 [Trebonia sp.]
MIRRPALRGRGGPLRGAHRGVEQAKGVPGQPGQRVSDARELAAAATT